MKTLIGIPCMEMSHSRFWACVLKLKGVGEAHLDIRPGSMVYDSRNEIAVDAITQNADRILMIDSDMRFDPDMMERMSKHMDDGCEMVCGLFFKRVIPTAPVIYSRIEEPTTDENGVKTRQIDIYENYPKDSLFEVQGCGFGAVMMTTKLVKDVWDHYNQPPFLPFEWGGEDLSFCYKVKQMGRKIWCDSSIKVGHIGNVEFGEALWLSQPHN